MPQVDAAGQRMWVVSGYDDVLAGLHHPDLGHGAPEPSPRRSARVAARQLISIDPPDHTRLRRLVGPDFTASAVAAMEPWIRDVVVDLVDGVRGTETFDVVTDLADPLPVGVIAALVGIPAEDRRRFRDWSAHIVAGDDPYDQASESFLDYIGALADHRRSLPAGDLLSRLAAQEAEGALDRDELLAMVQLLLVAGQETTVDLVANALLLLLSHPDQWAALVADPTLAGAVVEEVLRYRGPVEIAPPRRALRPVTLGGGEIPAGERVGLSLWAANRDPAVFADPHRFDVRRSDVGRHLAFGHGHHFCLGAALGRVEARIMLEHVAQGLPTLELGVAPETVSDFRLHRDGLPLRVRL